MPTKKNGNSVAEILRAMAVFLPALAAFIASMWAIWQSYNLSLKVKEIDANANNNGVAIQQIEKEKPPLPIKGDNLIILQIASYLYVNCYAAQEEINSYSGKFYTSPTLWATQDNKYIVVGVKAKSSADAMKLQQVATSLSQDKNLPSNDLRNAKIRANTGWKELSSCPK